MICKNCGKEHNGEYGSGQFCCKQCARSFSTKQSHGKLKEAKCIDCGKTIYIGLRASSKTCRCEECKNKLNYKKCPICGQIYNNQICFNEFCQSKSIKQFNLLIKYFGFDKTKLGTLEVENEFNRIRNLLYDLYWNKHMSNTDIKKYFNYNKKRSIIQNTFKYLGIPTRSYKQSTQNAILNNKLTYQNTNNQYKQQWHKTWNNKIVYLRSSYELEYAKKLDLQQIDYDVEKLKIKYFNTIKKEQRIAIPDFYIPSQNLIIEVKSLWTTNYQELKDKEIEYKKQGYNYKLIFEHNEYNTIDEIDKTKYRLNNNIFETKVNYKQKDGYNWIYKDNKQIRCNKNDLEFYIKNGWKIGRLCYKQKHYKFKNHKRIE